VEPNPPGVNDDLFLTQIAYTSRQDYDARDEFTSLRTFAIRARTGHIEGLGSDLPRVVAFGHGIFVSLRRDPFPQIAVYRWD
jgi:hypothetical protein